MNQDKRKTVPPNITHLMCYLVFTYNFLPTVSKLSQVPSIFACLHLFLRLRVHSHERRNELKPVWDLILVENSTSVFSQLITCVHMNWGQMKLKTVRVSYRSFSPKWNFKLAWDFHVSADSLDVAFNAHVRLKLKAGMDFISTTLTEIKFHYYANPTWNGMPTHVQRNIGSLWNATEMKLHVNRTCFHAGLKSQTSMSLCCF